MRALPLRFIRFALSLSLIVAQAVFSLAARAQAADISNNAPEISKYDLIIRHGTVYDGTGVAGVVQDIAVQGDRIAARGDLSRATGERNVDGTGLAVAPGFIDMLNHSESALIADGR